MPHVKREPATAIFESVVRNRADAQAVAARIRTARRHKRMTLEELARQAQLDKGYLSRIERGQKTPSVGALLQIANALGVPLGFLFGEATAPNAITIVRKGSQTAFPSGPDPADNIIKAVLPATSARRLSAVIAEPGIKPDTQHVAHPGDELAYVLQGAVEFSFADRTVMLRAGDCIHFDGHLLHQVRRVGRATARMFVCIAQDIPPASKALPDSTSRARGPQKAR